MFLTQESGLETTISWQLNTTFCPGPYRVDKTIKCKSLPKGKEKLTSFSDTTQWGNKVDQGGWEELGWNVPRKSGALGLRESQEEHGECCLQEFQIVLGSPKCQEVPWQAWVKDTRDHLECSSLWDRMEFLAGYASWGVWRLRRCGLKWEGEKNLTH